MYDDVDHLRTLYILACHCADKTILRGTYTFGPCVIDPTTRIE